LHQKREQELLQTIEKFQIEKDSLQQQSQTSLTNAQTEIDQLKKKMAEYLQVIGCYAELTF
jgi:uncharacterized coiled-coil DUF342 family protein